MLPRQWKAGRRERLACRAIGRKLDGTVKAAAAGLRMIEERRGRAALLDVLRRRDPQVTVVFDPNIRPRLWSDPAGMRQVLTSAAALADLVLPSFDDEAACFGDRTPEDTLKRYLDAGVAEVVDFLIREGGLVLSEPA